MRETAVSVGETAVGKNGKHLVTIDFSNEALEYLGGVSGEVGKAVLTAGLQLARQLYEDAITAREYEEGDAAVLH